MKIIEILENERDELIKKLSSESNEDNKDYLLSCLSVKLLLLKLNKRPKPEQEQVFNNKKKKGVI